MSRDSHPGGPPSYPELPSLQLELLRLRALLHQISTVSGLAPLGPQPHDGNFPSSSNPQYQSPAWLVRTKYLVNE